MTDFGKQCDAEGCIKQAKYLRIIELPGGRKLKFNLCEECNKLNWKVKPPTTEPKDDRFRKIPRTI